MILPGCEARHNCVDPRHLRTSEWNQKLGKIECNFRSMIRWDEHEMLSIYRGVSGICTPHRSVNRRFSCISVHPLLLINDVLGGHDQARWEMHLEAGIEWTPRYTWRPRLRDPRDALEDRNWVNSERHWEAIIERVWRGTWRLRLSAIGGVLPSGPFGRKRDSSRDSIHWLTCTCGNVESWVQRHPPEMGNWLRAGDCRSSDDAVLGVKSWSCDGEIERDGLTLYC